MELERVAGAIRPRRPWEAVDFGFAMAARWRRPVWVAWWATVAPAWALAYAPLALAVHPLWGLLAAWWLRPLFDRVPLAVLSRALFGEVPAAREVVRSLPRLWTAGALGALALRRFDPARSFHLPVHRLEGLAGAARRARLDVLGRERSGTAAGLTLACGVMEVCFTLALLGLAALLVPPGIEVAWGDHLAAFARGEAHPAFTLFAGAVALLAFTLVEPFYVAGGFALYLDRRTHLEGWDVELALRRLARRLMAGRRRGAAAALAALALAAALAGGPVAAQQPSRAAAAGAPEARGQAAAPGDPATAVERILAHPDFATRDTVRRWRLRERWLPDDTRRTPPALDLAWLAALGEVVLWVVGSASLVLLAVLVVRQGGSLRRRRRPRGPAALSPLAVGLAAAAESLPADVPAAALERFRAGAATEATGLLYRGALALLARRRAVAASWTEEECVRHLAAQLDAEGAAWFRRLAGSWQAAAYAHRDPVEEAFQGLCAGWRAHLGEAA